jgi:phage terminase large subunit-like protein
MKRTEEQKLKEIELLKLKAALKKGLPHIHGYPYYSWQREFMECENRYAVLCAANQIGKSSIQMRRIITWATDQSLWPKLWKTRPWQFWYLYPTKEVATIEFETKWTKEYLPAGEYKNHPVYGWKEEYRNRNIFAIHFKSGVSCYFKTYATDASALQTGTVWYVACDEELPSELYPEINMRIQATRGYFSMVFTATLNQAFWFDVIEAKGKNEKFPGWWKKQISMFDCTIYEDGTPSMWTRERINQVINSCGTETEVQRRVFGRFVTEKGLKYPSFNRERNIKTPDSVPSDWLWYSGIDIGSGGADNHPAAICLVALSPDMKRGRVVRSWRGDNQTTTTASDVVLKYKQMRGDRPFAGEYYDWAAKDFETIAVRSGVAVQPAEKSHDIGESLLNTLFKNQMLEIDDTEENKDLVDELSSLLSSTKKTKAKDDAIDSLRYACTKIPWNFEGITTELIQLTKAKQLSIDEQRAQRFLPEAQMEAWEAESEIGFWNDQYEQLGNLE